MLILLLAFFAQAQAAPPVHDLLDASAMNRAVDPCENFYQYSCGGWLKNFKLPPDKASYWYQSDPLTDHLEEQINDLLSKIGKNSSSASPYSKQLGDFYKTCMDTKSARKSSLPALKALLKKFDAVSDRKSIAAQVARLHLVDAAGLFNLYTDQDLKNSNQTIAFVDQGGMALPDRDYYLKDDPKSREIRERYKAHIVKMMRLAGDSDQESRATAEFVLGFETALAQHALPKDDRRDTQKLFHPMSFADLKTLAPAFDWDAYFENLATPAPKKINVSEPDFVRNLNELLTKTNARDLSRYFKWEMIRHSAYYVDGPLREENFRFWAAYLEGAKEMPPRWKYCTRLISGEMSEALGQAYVQSIPNAAEIRTQTESMLSEIRLSFLEDLDDLNWMDTSTRENARKKLDKMGKKVGWPDHWRDYSKLKTDPHSFFENVMRTNEFETRRNLAKMDKPTDRSEWLMATWEPNAYYQDSNNELVLPLGELVPPVFDPRFSDGANYGSLGGGTIGHELTHGFDDSGKDKDGDGNFVTWWTPKAQQLFESKSACFIQQTEKYDILPGSGLHIRGKATLGENLADNGGVKLGLIALKKAISARPSSKAMRDFQGFNEIQQYFIAYAQSWCVKTTEEHLRDQLLTDFHPPSEFRVNGVLSNQPEFAKAFGCRAGSRMAPENRCSIW